MTEIFSDQEVYSAVRWAKDLMIQLEGELLKESFSLNSYDLIDKGCLGILNSIIDHLWACSLSRGGRTARLRCYAVFIVAGSGCWLSNGGYCMAATRDLVQDWTVWVAIAKEEELMLSEEYIYSRTFDD